MSAVELTNLPGLEGRSQPLGSQVADRAARKRARARTTEQILGEGLFRDAFVRERKRADRFDTPFAVLLVDRGDSRSKAGGWFPIVRAVSAVKRDADVVGWLEHGAVLGLILTDMPGRAAQQAMHELQRDLVQRLGPSALDALSIRLYAHDTGPAANRAPIPPVDLLVEAFAAPRRHRSRDAAKRALDIAASLALLVFLSPVFLGCAAAVKWTSRGPAFFRQVRVGRRGEPFTMFKFRSMYVDNQDTVHDAYMTWFITSSGKQARTGNEVFKLTNDPRVTRVGQFLRKTSLDELPQFWNVLIGDMSLVGPRPPIPSEVAKYQPWHRRRVLEAKPGITGLWQVNGRSRTTFDEMVRLDLRYARSHTLWMDVKILAATPRAVLSGKGAC